MADGIVKWFHSKKGYGFITVNGEESKDIFVHYSAITVEANGFRTLHQNDKVSFTITDGAKGQEAHDVKVTEAAPYVPRKRTRGPRKDQDEDAAGEEEPKE